MYHIYPSGKEPIQSVWKRHGYQAKGFSENFNSIQKKGKNNNNSLLLLLVNIGEKTLQPFSLKEFLYGQKKIRYCT